MNLTKTILHKFDPEWIHDRAIQLGKILGNIENRVGFFDRLYGLNDQRLEVVIGNLKFPNPIGLAAGFDKDGVIVPLLQALGFGFVEVGTVTPLPQPGNPKPRLFRIKKQSAVINRMGFNNHGIDALISSIKKVRKKIPVGVNLGKNKSTSIDLAVHDYLIGMQKCWEVADYFTINISSPNTENLRDLQSKKLLQPLIKTLVSENQRLTESKGIKKQIWLKIAPDLGSSELETICEVVLEEKVDAMVVSNTTIERTMLSDQWKNQSGGLSGRPLFEKSNKTLEKVSEITKGQIPLIGVGGIFNAEDVKRKLSLGATLVQLYTSLVFEGPGIVNQIKKDMIRSL